MLARDQMAQTPIMILNIVRDARRFIDEVCIACFTKKKLREKMAGVFRNVCTEHVVYSSIHQW